MIRFTYHQFGGGQIRKITWQQNNLPFRIEKCNGLKHKWVYSNSVPSSVVFWNLKTIISVLPYCIFTDLICLKVLAISRL